MKKSLLFILALMTALVLFGCGSKPAEEATTKVEEPASKKEIYVLIKARGDLSYWDSMADGGDRAKEDFKDKANVYVIETTADLQANLTAMYEAADKGANMIVTSGDFIDNMVEVAEQYPDIAFVMINEKIEGYKNIYAIDFKTSEAGFLAGICAADVAKANNSNVVGFIGGMDEVNVIQEFFLGYIQGAKYYNPKIEVSYSYVGDWGDPDKGKTQALAQYNDKDVAVIFACAGGSGNGVHQAAADVGRYVIGVDSDQSLSYAEQPKIQQAFVTSVLKNIGNGIHKVIENYLNDGTLNFGKYEIFGIKEGAVGIVKNELYNNLISAEGKAAVDKAEKGIIDSSITVVEALGKEQAEIQAEIAKQLGK